MNLIDSFNENDYYKIGFTPKTIENRVIPVNIEEADKFKDLLSGLIIDKQDGIVYYNGFKYINTLFKDDAQDLKILDEGTLSDNIYFKRGIQDNVVIFDDVFLGDILLHDFSKDKLEEFSDQANNLGFDIKVVSLKTELSEERSYYLDGLIFGVVVIII
ncbi:MAG: hypothetical protein ACRCTA_07375, partial [Bacilli bacterium]